MNQEDQGPAARRSHRPRSGLAIFDEALLFELHAEMMQKEEVTKRPRSNNAMHGRPPRPPSRDDGTPRALGHEVGENSDDQRAAKRARSGASSGTPRGGGTSADDEYGYDDDDGPNARTAWACGLNFEGLSEDEKSAGLLPSDANPQEYAKVRNRVLAMWRKDVSKKLLVKDALDAVKPRDRSYALAAWQFLNAMGYINFGVSPEIQSDVKKLTQDTRGTVIVVGAGCAGLSTARQLRSWGYRVIVVEGRNRPGGRVFSSGLSGPLKNAVVADVGGSIITGIDGNPLAVLTKQLKIPLSHIRDRAPIFMPDGTPADDTLDSAVEQYYNHTLMKGCNGLRAKPEIVEDMSLQGALEKLWTERYGELERLLPEVAATALGISGTKKKSSLTGALPNGASVGNGTSDGDSNVAQYPLVHPTARKARQLFEWHLANLEFANACKLDTCSLLHWDQDDPFELPGAHCFVPGCNGRWVQALAQDIPILYDHPVTEVRYCKTGVAVHTGPKILHADAVVVTVPLGVLKRGGIAFNPPLSEHKWGAISRLGFGNLNKVILMFPKVFWSEDEDMFGHVAEDPVSRGEAFLFYSYAHISGGAQLTALIAGSAAEEHEKRSAADSVTRVMAILRSIYEPKGVVVPAPLQALITRWGSDPMAYGAYSSLPIGSHGGEDYDIMAKSVGGRLFFAGEATTRRYPATMHGAFFTGLWAAADVDAALSKFKNVPQFSNIASVEVVKAATLAEEEKTAARTMASLAAAVKEPPRPPSSQGGGGDGAGYTYYKGTGVLKPRTPEELALLDKMVNDKLFLSSRLKMLFDDPEHSPDLEVGSFKAVYGAPGSHVAHQALLRMDISSARGKYSKEERDGTRQVNLYCVVLKDTAMAVAEQADNYARVALLGSLPSVKLVERTGLGPDAMSVMDSVMRWRRKKETSLGTAAAVVAAKRAVASTGGNGVVPNNGGAAAAAGPSGNAANTNGVATVIAFNNNTYLPPPPERQQQQQQQQQQQHQVAMFYNGTGTGIGTINPAAVATTSSAAVVKNTVAAAGAGAIPNGNGWLKYHEQQRQQHQQQQQQYGKQRQVKTRNEEPAPAAVQNLEQPAAAEAMPAPQPAAVPAPGQSPRRTQPAFSALDIALGLAVSSIDIVDLTNDD